MIIFWYFFTFTHTSYSFLYSFFFSKVRESLSIQNLTKLTKNLVIIVNSIRTRCYIKKKLWVIAAIVCIETSPLDSHTFAFWWTPSLLITNVIIECPLLTARFTSTLLCYFNFKLNWHKKQLFSNITCQKHIQNSIKHLRSSFWRK